MPRCCGGASCSCVIQSGAHMQIAGTGSTDDPFVLIADVDLEVTDNTTFDLTLGGLGTNANPWTIGVNFAATAKLTDLPDVNAPAPTNAQVLGWNSTTNQWEAQAPTTAAAGSVTHDTSLAGDGSAGTPLQVQEDPARYLATTGAGLGLSDAGMNSIVRRYTDATARSTATPAPVLNSLSMLDSTPGQIDTWNGTAWVPAGVFALDMTGQQLLSLSGPYTGTQRVTFIVRNVSATTDSLGVFDVIPALDLAGRAGVLSVSVQPTAGSTGITQPYSVMVVPDAGGIKGVAFQLTDGTPLALVPITCTVTAYLY